jgi:arylsulfatase A-like enzyme
MNVMTYQSAEDTDKKSFTFWNCFRLVFIIFFLYLIGDVFYRWDAFKLHSSFSQYLPNVALASIIWSIVAILSSLVVWLPLKAFERIFGYLGLKIKAEHLVLFLFTFVSVAAFAWIVKKIIWSNAQTPLQLKIIVIVCISCIAIFLAWLFRGKAGLWLSAIAERITPLVWLFAICITLSLLIVGFHLWGDTTNRVLPHMVTKSAALEAGEKRPNILLVTFDALFARRMSVYGYNRETTPFMKKWAKSASLFKRTEASSSYTAPTTSSIITGKRVWTHRKYQHDPAAHPLNSNTENLALVLKENGYYTSAYIVNGVASVNALGISSSIDTAPLVTEFFKPGSIEGFIEKYLSLLFGNKFSTYNWIGQDDFIFTVLLRKIDKEVFTTEVPPKLAFNKFLEVMDNNPHKPFFAWIHLFVPHAPYTPPRPFAGTFNSSWELREKNKIYSYNPEIRKYNNKINSDLLPFPEELKEKIKLLRDYYDEFILYSDKQFENFIDDLRKRDWFNNTVIIVSADHGESFYEHNYFQHGSPHLYEQVTNIPLIIKEPDQVEGRIIDDLVEQIDIPATILGLANIPVPSWIEGRSLLPLLRDKELPAKTAISVSLMQNSRTDPITIGTIAVWQDDYKLIHFLDNGRTLLFNLKKDPDELNNLFDKDPGTGQQLLSFINDNLKEVNEKILAEKHKIQ